MRKTKRTTKKEQEPESDDYLNGVHKKEWGAAWTRQQGARFVETLKVLAVQGKYQTTGEKPIVNNYEMAVHEMAKQDSDFEKYLKAPGGPWKTRKYDALY